MSIDRRQYGRVDFDTSIKILILEPYSQRVDLVDASFNGLKIITDLDLVIDEIVTCKNVELENSIPFKAKIIWKTSSEDGLYHYGMQITK